MKQLLAVSLFATASAMAAVDPALLKLVMPDAKVLSGIQVDQSAASPFGQYVLSQMQPDQGFLKFITSTGFDPRHDLHEILAATSGDPTTSHSGVILGRGVFQPAQIAAAATAEGGVVTQYQGINVLTSAEQNSTGAVAFLDSTTAVIGDLDSVKAAIDRRISGSNFTGPLAQKAQDVSAANQAWFATLTPLSDFLNGKLGNANLNNVTQNNLLQSVLQASGGVNFGSSAVTVSADAVTSSNQNAQALADVLKFLASMISTNDPQAGSLASAATFTANGSVMHFSMSLSEQQMEQLFMPGSGLKAGMRAKRPVPARQ
jgi:hypothetical protein